MTSDQAADFSSDLRPFSGGAVLFDCDGVLVNSEPISLSTLGDVLRHFGAPLSAQDIATRFTGRSSAAPIRHIHDTTGQDVSASFKPVFYDRLFARYQTELHKINGIDAVLHTLRDRGTAFCISSSSSVARLEVTMEVTGLGHWFEGRVYSADFVANGKPAPDLFLFAAEKMGFAPDQCLVIEDSVAGVQAAVAAGIACWGFVGGGHYEDDRDQATDRLIAAGAGRVFRTMDDINVAFAGTML
ncbi:HAD family phosphatase [Thalassospira sp.]|uniref:HAD family hydrolase n=1 Tax=Thalassospira sp. TaxID=1912094 RepID=UPI0027341CDF|nr:HAD-IA family hydrolase [Thalassospira sp.]MDP2698266.1 HAD-IA family hydrolase [Thalassospira sp.]